MPNCGINKYDNLPGRVGFKDIDALRYSLIEYRKEKKKLEKKIKNIRNTLEEAYRQWQSDNN